MNKLVILYIFLTTCTLSAFGQITERRTFHTFNGKALLISVRDTLEDVRHSTLRIFNQNESKLLLHSPLIYICLDNYQYNVMAGNFELTDSTIVLYHFWAKAGDAPAFPYGAAVKTYEITGDSLILKTSELYLETMSDDYIIQYKDSIDLGYQVGCLFLHQSPSNDAEQQQLNTYISEVERKYNGVFLLGTKGRELVNRVREKLEPDLLPYTGDWEWRYKDDRFGYRK